MGPFFEIVKHLAQHLVIHAGQHLLSEMNEKRHLNTMLPDSQGPPSPPRISFLVDANGVASMTNEYRKYHRVW